MADPRYVNRELSWLAFNERVLDQAAAPRHPLLERLRFLVIFSRNLDEFFRVRVGGLTALAMEHIEIRSIDGRSPAEQLVAIRERIAPMLRARATIWNDELRPALEREGIVVLEYDALAPEERQVLDERFARDYFPLLTPLAVAPGRGPGELVGGTLHLAVELCAPSGERRLAVVEIPPSIPALITLEESELEIWSSSHRFVTSESLIRAHLDSLFPGNDPCGVHAFRLLRDADEPLVDAEVSDLMLAMEAHLRRRHAGRVVRLELEEGAPARLPVALLGPRDASALSIETIPRPLDVTILEELVERAGRSDLRYPTLTPALPYVFRDPDPLALFAALRERDHLVHHPYDSFDSVLRFINAAASDPDVVAIKQTLYRIGRDAPVVEALLRARRAGKQVAVLVELKARFDEENNIEWARTLEDEGVHVVYGLIGLKTHCKVTLVVRREPDGLRRYVHIGTGNYNAVTARQYTDLGLFSGRPELGDDATQLFNALTGYSSHAEYRALLVAPFGLREALIQRIEAQAERARAGERARIFFKVNALIDREVIDALYAAAEAGVKIRLLVRSACSLRPGVEGLSERIQVRSVVGRFLEHARVYLFGSGDDAECWIGSADLMGRNLDRRIEALVRVERPQQRDYIHQHVLKAQWHDRVNGYRLDSDGSYRPRGKGGKHDSHAYLIALHHQMWRRGYSAEEVE